MAERKKKLTKKKKHILLKIAIALLILLVLFIVLCAITPKEEDAEPYSYSVGERIPNLELPAPLNKNEEIITHTGYTLSYNEEYEVANWVAYELTKEEVIGGGSRKDNFRADPAVSTGSATLADYRGSGYDRGHLAPAASFKWSDEAMDDTFYMSNMTPQEPDFNRGIWADLEAAVRTMAYDNGSLYVVTGPILTDGPYKTIGKNKVAVPKYFYKVLLDYSEPELKAIGFILPNEGSKKSLESFAVSVDEVERVTGIDFYPRLPDDIEETLESSFDTSLWSFRAYTPTGESADVSYVAPSQGSAGNSENEIRAMIVLTLYNIKKEIFAFFNLTKEAKALGLL